MHEAEVFLLVISSSSSPPRHLRLVISASSSPPRHLLLVISSSCDRRHVMNMEWFSGKEVLVAARTLPPLRLCDAVEFCPWSILGLPVAGPPVCPVVFPGWGVLGWAALDPSVVVYPRVFHPLEVDAFRVAPSPLGFCLL